MALGNPNVARVRREVLRRMVYPCKDAEAINVGDLLVYNSGDGTVSSALTITDAGGTTAAARKVIVQDAVDDVFVGIAEQAKLTTETSKQIMVAVDAIAEYPCAALGAAVKVGDGIAIDASDASSTGTATPQIVIPDTVAPIGTAMNPQAIGDLFITARFIGIHAVSVQVSS